MRGWRAGLHGMCGLNLIVDFYGYGNYVDPKTLRQGVGFSILGFNQGCRDVYEEYSKKYNIVYQSPVRTNTRSGNQFFFAVFDTRQPKVKQ